MQLARSHFVEVDRIDIDRSQVHGDCTLDGFFVVDSLWPGAKHWAQGLLLKNAWWDVNVFSQ